MDLHHFSAKPVIPSAASYLTVVIPVCLSLRRKGAGIQEDTGYRIKSGMTELAD